MLWKQQQFQITSSCPMIPHNGQLADPTNEITVRMKKISGKRNKTESDHMELGRLEFIGGLYMDENGPIVPNYVWDSCIVAASKKSKEGPLSKLGVFTQESMSLEYDGPRTADELWEEGFWRKDLVVVSRSRIVRTRPEFKVWSGVLTVNYDPTVVDGDRVIHWVKVAGLQIGLCDWRPKFGRFDVEVLS